MAKRICKNGHSFEKTSSCPVCPICSSEEVNEKFGEEFPQLSAPAFRALERIGITSLADLKKYTEEELLALHGFGPSAIKKLRPALAAKGWTFKK